MTLRPSRWTAVVALALAGCAPRVDAVSTGDVASCSVVEGTLDCRGVDLPDGVEGGGMLDRDGQEDLVERAPSGPIRTVDLGFAHGCALDDDGMATCWAAEGACCPGLLDPPDVPLKRLAVGDFYGACGLDLDGRLNCWGDLNGIDVSAFSNVSSLVDVSFGYRSICVVDLDGNVRCTTGVPGRVSWHVGPFVRVESGAYVDCALNVDGEVSCWGQVSDAWHHLPGGPYRDFDVGRHFCGVQVDGSLVCWPFDPQSVPLALPTGTFRSVSVSTGALRDYACAVSDSDEVVCFGAAS